MPHMKLRGVGFVKARFNSLKKGLMEIATRSAYHGRGGSVAKRSYKMRGYILCFESSWQVIFAESVPYVKT